MGFQAHGFGLTKERNMTFNKAIAALVAPIIGMLASLNILPENFSTPEFTTAVVSIVTAIAVYFVPNK